jgi:hypothetical protein
MGDPVIDRTMAVRIATQLGWEPKREWVGLTDQEITYIESMTLDTNDAIRMAAVALMEKNT